MKKEIGFSELQVNEVCIVFWLFKRDSKHRIDIYYGDQKIHTLSDRYLYWTEIFVPLSVSTVPQFLTFSVSYNGVALDGGIAIDDFKILTSPCSGKKLVFLSAKGRREVMTNKKIIKITLKQRNSLLVLMFMCHHDLLLSFV